MNLPGIETAGPAEPRVYAVREIVRTIKTVLEDEVGSVWVEGEISNLRRPTSGHLYFTLKDEEAQLSAVLFRGAQRGLTVELRDGLRVRAEGEISLYERSGQVQLVARRILAAGVGALQAALEKLKQKLQAEGLFDRPRRAIPRLPRCVGLVTSPTGAALRDILQILQRRFPNLHLVLAPVRVQGEGAAQEIADAIDRFSQWGGADVLIVGRGGGSLEDLWAFNEEAVARAIVRSSIPVISAVGHEIDVTLSDAVADLRAPTPSAAAELVVGRKEDFERQLGDASRLMARLLQSRCLEVRNRLTTLSSSRVFHEPAAWAGRQHDRIEALQARSGFALRDRFRQAQQTADDLQLRLRHAAKTLQREAGEKTRRLDAQLRALSPYAVLARGFSLTRTPDGHVIRDVSQ
ncbi:MAG: exodeoxyribonuclease VII large subunit, partial [Kiritimatiellia bacterium]|nr:exodeoxyribonuclease VII large subunit [Kiritimatiellia bacterium]